MHVLGLGRDLGHGDQRVSRDEVLRSPPLGDTEFHPVRVQP
jgi:hypothetical protein